MQFGTVLSTTKNAKVNENLDNWALLVSVPKKLAKKLNITLPTEYGEKTYMQFLGYNGEYWPLVLEKAEKRGKYWLYSHGTLTRLEIAEFIESQKS